MYTDFSDNEERYNAEMKELDKLFADFFTKQDENKDKEKEKNLITEEFINNMCLEFEKEMSSKKRNEMLSKKRKKRNNTYVVSDEKILYCFTTKLENKIYTLKELTDKFNEIIKPFPRVVPRSFAHTKYISKYFTRSIENNICLYQKKSLNKIELH